VNLKTNPAIFQYLHIQQNRLQQTRSNHSWPKSWRSSWQYSTIIGRGYAKNTSIKSS